MSTNQDERNAERTYTHVPWECTTSIGCFELRRCDPSQLTSIRGVRAAVEAGQSIRQGAVKRNLQFVRCGARVGRRLQCSRKLHHEELILRIEERAGRCLRLAARSCVHARKKHERAVVGTVEQKRRVGVGRLPVSDTALMSRLSACNHTAEVAAVTYRHSKKRAGARERGNEKEVVCLSACNTHILLLLTCRSMVTSPAKVNVVRFGCKLRE